MMATHCVLFDMDGTLVNSYEGIYRSYAWTMAQMNLPFGGHGFVKKAIGAPLQYVFSTLCGLDALQTKQAIALYRTYYQEWGMRQLSVYDGLPDCLAQLGQSGCRLGVATLKKESYAREILEQAGLLRLFGAVCGMDDGDQLSKADLLCRCMQKLGGTEKSTILVGDSVFDAVGAREAGIAFLPVTYGFGFQNPEEREWLRGCPCVNGVEELVPALSKWMKQADHICD